MQNKIDDLRNHLFATLDALRDKEAPMDIERAKAISSVANSIIETAKVEVKYLEAVGGHGTGFMSNKENALKASVVPHLVRKAD